MKKSVLGSIIAVIAIAVVVGVLAMGSKDDDPGTETTAQNPAPASANEPQPTAPTPPAQDDDDEETAGDQQVTISDFAFNPASLTVKKGTTVTWTNRDGVAHTVTSDDGGPLDSGLFANGKTFSFTFNEAGSFPYHCEPHPEMTGTVTVTD